MGNSLLSSPITDIETERGVLHSAYCKQKRASSLNYKTSCPTDSTSRPKTLNIIPQCSNLMHLCSSQEPEECSSFAISSCQGWRLSMEDEHICEPELKCMDDDIQKVLHQHSLFCIFDGHGGKFASSFCKKHFLEIFYKTSEYRQYCKLYTLKQNSNTQKPKRKTKKNKQLNEESNEYKTVLDPDAQLCSLLQAAISKTCIEIDVQMLTEMKNMQRDGRDTQQIEQWNVTQEGYEFFDTGTTALILILTPNYIICGNLGDCRAILIKKGLMSSTSSSSGSTLRSSSASRRNPIPNIGKNGSNANNIVFDDDVIPLSFDHKPSNEVETKRITAAGGSVTAGKIDGVLAVSRGLGDFTFKDESTILPKKQKTSATMKTFKPPMKHTKEKKKGGFCGKTNDAIVVENPDKKENTPSAIQNKVSSTPDFIVIDRDEENELFLVAGCDGIFDVVSNQECGALVSTLFQEGERDVGYLVEEAIEICLRKGSMDNMSMLVIKFPEQKIGNGGGVMKRRKARLAKQQMGESQRQPMGEI